MKPICLPALLAVLSMTTLLPAQTKPVSPVTDPAKVTDLSRIDLKIDSVPLPDLVDYLAETTGKNMVLLVPPNIDASTIRVPPLKLRHVSLEQILDLIMQMPGTELSYDVSGESDSQIYSIRVEAVMPPPAPPAVPGAPMPSEPFAGETGMTVTGDAIRIQIPSGTTEPFLSVLPLERIFLGSSPAERVPDDAKRKEMLDERTQQANMLLDQAFEMTPEGQSKPEIKLHAETNTLLVKATPAQLQVINQVLGALEVPGPSDSKRDLDRRAIDMERQMEVERQRLATEMEKQSVRMQHAIARAEQTQEELAARVRALITENEQLKAQLQAMKEQKPSQPQ